MPLTAVAVALLGCLHNWALLFCNLSYVDVDHAKLSLAAPCNYQWLQLKGTIQRFAHAQLALKISIPVPSCTGTVVPHSRCVLGLP